MTYRDGAERLTRRLSTGWTGLFVRGSELVLAALGIWKLIELAQ